MRDVIFNELHDRERDSHWEYRSNAVTPSQNLVREQVETSQGPIFRVLERGGRTLDADQARQEEARLNEYVKSPGQIEHVQHEHEVDEERLAGIMKMLPKAFLFEYEGSATGDVVRIAFRPDPAFVPDGYEARVVHVLAGTLTVDQRLKRMIDMDGHLIERVDFGFGILGHVEKGGTFEIHRVQVSAERWKTSLVAVHIQGKVLLFKNVSKDQQETRSDFRPVPHDISLQQAKEMLDHQADASLPVEARLAAGGR
uniref:Uncharacterized protein n=1 Tax=Paracidobacterium acidisoli TaxID=2303751 RepID=A0A372IRW0_9BACT